MSDWPGKFVGADKLQSVREEREGDVTVFDDGGVRYITAGERTKEWLWMENVPEQLENRC